ncbi:hypothetical protein OC842_001751 [Tilletia horrida]|uniref:HMG box domain-containing protein n=1 Tax=Tilletia horrida TaxID=155126 RepID=A0AAN6GEI1_9BASI|nr:hypothetical protein OC842_001751 [Tilletia horrida]
MYGGSGSTGGRVPNGSAAAGSMGMSPMQHQQQQGQPYGHHQMHHQQQYDAHLQSQHAQQYSSYPHHQAAYAQHYGQHQSAMQHAGMIPSAQLAQMGIPPSNTSSSSAAGQGSLGHHPHHPHLSGYGHHAYAGGHPSSYAQHHAASAHHGGQPAYGGIHPDLASGGMNPQQAAAAAAAQQQSAYGLMGHPSQQAAQQAAALHHGASAPAQTIAPQAASIGGGASAGQSTTASTSGSGSGAGRKRKKAAVAAEEAGSPAEQVAVKGGGRGKGAAAASAASGVPAAPSTSGNQSGSESNEPPKKASRGKKRSRSDTQESGEGPASKEKSGSKPLKSLLKPPKQAPSAWQIFFTAELHKIKQQTPGERLNVAHVAREAGQRYAALPDSAKAEYQRQSQLAKEQWERDMQTWKASLTPEDIKRENLFRAAQRKAGKSRKGNLKDPNAPKKPLSAYFLFLRAIRANPQMMQDVFEGEAETTKQSVLAAAKWRQLSEEDKKPYLEKAEEDKQRYERLRREYDANKGLESSSSKPEGGHLIGGHGGSDGPHNGVGIGVGGGDKLENYLEGFGDDDDEEEDDDDDGQHGGGGHRYDDYGRK